MAGNIPYVAYRVDPESVAARLADELREAAAAARWAGQADLAQGLGERVEVFRLAADLQRDGRTVGAPLH